MPPSYQEGLPRTLDVGSTEAPPPKAAGPSVPVWIPVVILVIGGLFGTAVLTRQGRDYEARRIHFEFERHAEDRLDLLEREIGLQIDAAEQLAILFRSTEEVPRATFGIYASAILKRYTGLQALEWVPRVTPANRQALLSEARRDLPDFEFRHRQEDGSLARAPEQDELFPIYYVEPLAGNELALGFTPTDLPERDEAIARAIQGETLSLSAPIELIQGRQEAAIMVFSPVYRREGDGKRTLLGLSEAVFWVDRLLDETLATSRGHGIRIRLLDRTTSPPRILYRSGPEWTLSSEEHEHLRSRSLELGGRLWELQATAAPGYFQHDQLVMSVISGSGLLITLALAGILGVLLQRERHVTGIVAERTYELAHQAAHDPLTGLINRREFDGRLMEAISHCQSQGEHHALLYLDLDQFKVVNDSCGHAAGDEMLKQLAKTLRKTIRNADVLARLGGDEFGLLLSGCSPGTEVEPVNKILDAIRNSRFVWSGRTFAIGASIGVVHLHRNTENAAIALSQADAACYIAKERGRNRYHVFHDEDTASGVFRRQLEWVAELRDALDANRFRLLSQPIRPCALPSGTPFEELMLVLERPDGRSVSAVDFVPAAERYGLMPMVDRWVVERTFYVLSTSDKKECLYSINISGQSIGDDTFCEFVEEMLARYRIDPKQICFEITETAAVANLVVAQSFIHRLRRRGCRFALDDFGSGMSSFQYLRQLPVDFVKIDGSFVRSIAEDERDRAVVAAIHEIAAVHRVQTVAECVESKEILAVLRKIGVHHAQGFFMGRPEPLVLEESS